MIIQVINFSLKNASYSGITAKKAEPQVEIELEDVVFSYDKGFCYWYLFYKWLSIQTVEVVENILVILTALQKLHNQHKIPLCLQMIFSPC